MYTETRQIVLSDALNEVKFIKDWKKLGYELKLSDTIVHNIEQQSLGDVQLAKKMVLYEWIKKGDDNIIPLLQAKNRLEGKFLCLNQ